ncbi:putative replication factor C, large subunit [Namao virus]|nr:putative replication factor C, large subunit [Namao virus]
MASPSNQYQSFLAREGPRALGSRPVPPARDGCMQGLVFVLTGVMECIGRDEIKALLLACGASVTTCISRKTSYLVAGRDSGPSKMQRAQAYHVPVIDEPQLFDMIWLKTSAQPDPATAATKQASKPAAKQASKPSSKKAATAGCKVAPADLESPDGALWSDRHAPHTLKEMIGQSAAQSVSNRLVKWLQSWHAKTSPPVLISGPAGSGKTLVAVLACQHLGLSYVELNASCPRSKEDLRDTSLDNASIHRFFAKPGQALCAGSVLIMDEIDNMSGSKDRGGLQEAVRLLKTAKFPVIYICTDRYDRKIQTLAARCTHLSMSRPPLEKIMPYIECVAKKENVCASPSALSNMVVDAGCDVRHALVNMQFWCTRSPGVVCHPELSSIGKDVRMGPFDVCKTVLVKSEARRTVDQKLAVFFYDYSMAPLFVQENYVSAAPVAAGSSPTLRLALTSLAADAICDGDTVDRQIRLRQAWHLLPAYGVYSTILPGELVQGALERPVAFPRWLGKQSSLAKNRRVSAEIYDRVCLRASIGRVALNTELLPYMRFFLTAPLALRGAAGVAEAVARAGAFRLDKPGVDAVFDAQSQAVGAHCARVPGHTKAAFTRALNRLASAPAI